MGNAEQRKGERPIPRDASDRENTLSRPLPPKPSASFPLGRSHPPRRARRRGSIRATWCGGNATENDRPNPRACNNLKQAGIPRALKGGKGDELACVSLPLRTFSQHASFSNSSLALGKDTLSVGADDRPVRAFLEPRAPTRSFP